MSESPIQRKPGEWMPHPATLPPANDESSLAAPTGSAWVSDEIYVFRHTDTFPQEPWVVWAGPFKTWGAANAWIVNQGGWPGLLRPGKKQIVWDSPNNKVSYHADNAGGAHEKDTNDK